MSVSQNVVPSKSCQNGKCFNRRTPKDLFFSGPLDVRHTHLRRLRPLHWAIPVIVWYLVHLMDWSVTSRGLPNMQQADVAKRRSRFAKVLKQPFFTPFFNDFVQKIKVFPRIQSQQNQWWVRTIIMIMYSIVLHIYISISVWYICILTYPSIYTVYECIDYQWYIHVPYIWCGKKSPIDFKRFNHERMMCWYLLGNSP